ncbi:MAG TPA: HD-GYP domain-containing protein [Azospirillum sp.]|nr:HD-GYP domain-containing protein [Azospirillum sp.]
MAVQSFSTKISVAYAAAGAAWILAGSGAADHLFEADVAGLWWFEIAKGLAFVGVTALALKLLLRRELRRRSATEEAHAHTAERLEVLLQETVGALSHTLSQRDPYTAGHQERVAALSVAIAQRMGLDKERVDSIRIGALLHDIGKISIPAELLSKPGRLTTDEFALVKGHVASGQAIVGKIAFPPAVHAVVGQHHERLDGSGYPAALAGDAIALEARIVAVADVVEAMISHRPYRPGLGIRAAVEEIRAQRGTRLDAAVVDACLAVVGEEMERVWPAPEREGAAPADLAAV